MLDDAPQRLHDAADQLGRMAFRHTTPILLAPPDAPDGAMCSGSGFVVQLGTQKYLGTAWHVVEHWQHLKAQDGGVLFQVGGVGLDPSSSLAWTDADSDVAFLRLTTEQAVRIPASMCEPLLGWPPPRLERGSDVFVCGFPGQLRDRPGYRDVDFKSIVAHLVIEEVRDRFALCALDRNFLADVNGVDVPIENLDLGGMSGGPGFLMGRLSYPLVALVSQFSQTNETFGLVRLATLAHVGLVEV